MKSGLKRKITDYINELYEIVKESAVGAWVLFDLRCARRGKNFACHGVVANGL